MTTRNVPGGDTGLIIRHTVSNTNGWPEGQKDPMPAVLPMQYEGTKQKEQPGESFFHWA